MDLYSRAARIIRDLPQQKGTAEQLKAMALKVGAKPVEFEHARFDKKFSGPTTKDELAQHLEQSMPQITETVYGATPKMKLAENRLFEIHPEIEAIDEALRALLVGGEVPEEFGGAEANQNELEQRYYELVNEREKLYEQATRKNPRFADYQTPGGDNYREVLLQLNGNLEGAITVGAYKSAIRQALIDDMGNEAEADAYLRAKKDRHVEHMPVHIIKQAREKLGFQEDNHQRVASNIRFGDANNDDAVMFALQHTNSHWPEKDVLAHIRMKDRVDEATGQKVLHVEELQSDWAQEARQKGFSEVPYHPLIADTGAWLELALKRIGQEAAQGGYDKVIFTPGQAQADRYSLEKQVRSVSWSPDTQYLTAKTIPGGELFNQTVPKDKLPQYVGKELAERLLATEPKMYPGENVAYHSLIGDDLRVGGTGMKTFYDNVVPKTANKLFGKQGARIEPFGHTEQDGSQYHVMNVTPEMKQQYAGAVPAFAQGGEVEERVIPPGHPERRENLADWNKGNKLVDQQGNPLTLYRGAVGHKELPEGFLQGKTRSNYATFTSTSPSLASTYANVDRSSDPDAVGGVMPIHAHAHVLHEFPTKGPSFDKFAFDKFARSLPKGHAVVARQVLDIGPRASNATDPEKRYSYPSDIYAWNEANSVKSAIGNRGTFDPNDPDITKAEGGEAVGKAIGGGTFEGKKVPDAKRLARVADKFIYHSGIADQLPDMKWGLEPQHGDWVREVASSTGLDEDELLDRSVPLVWMSDDPSWVGMKVARKLGKHPHNVTRDDIREHGHVAMIPRKGDHAEHVWYVGDRGLDNGEYSTVTNLNGKTAKAYETDLYDHDDMSGRKEPFGVERNEYVSARPVEPMFHLTGDDLVDFLDATGHIPAKATGGEVEDEGITAYHGSPHDFEQFDLSKIGTGEGAQAYGHGLYFAENEGIARGYRNRLGFGSGLSPEDTAKRLLLASNEDREAALETARQAHERAMKSGDQAAMEHARSVRDIINTQPEKALGRMYEVRINAHPDHFLDWDAPLAGQKHVIDAIDRHIGDPEAVMQQLIGHQDGTGRDLYEALGGEYKASAVSQKLHEMGIKGVRYLDANSRDEGAGTRNYVVFDDKLVNVKRKYADGGEV